MAAFVLPTPFLWEGAVEPRVPQHREARPVVAALTARVHQDGAGRVAAFADLPARLGLTTGHRLLQAGWRVAPLYGRWPAPEAVLPGRPLADWLLGLTAAMGTRHVPEAAPLCLLLDGERTRPVSAATLRQRFDNRFSYLAHMLPPAAHLERWGVQYVVWAGTSATVRDDLAPYAESLANAGLALDVMRVTAGT
jgi:hypothetical protein